jgi:hypothetical protein
MPRQIRRPFRRSLNNFSVSKNTMELLWKRNKRNRLTKDKLMNLKDTSLRAYSYLSFL